MAYSSWVAALAGTAMLVSSLPASAQVVRFDRSMTETAAPLVTNVQFRGGYGGRRFHGGYGGYRGGYGRHRGGRGAAIGAGIAGLAAGALIGGAIASQAQPAYGAPVYADPGYGYAPAPVYAPQPVGDASDYCAQRYKSYDPSSGTFLGYDGARHPCP